MALLDNTAAVVVAYKYDAWGRPIKKEGSLAATLGTVQPFRYRGYVYDEETGLYYLRSRYYSAAWCRFINADALITNNLFSYCVSNPVMLLDPSGYHFSLLEEYAGDNPGFNAEDYGPGCLNKDKVFLRQTPCQDYSIPVVELLKQEDINGLYIKRGAYVIEGESTSSSVKSAQPGRVWLEVIVFYYYDSVLVDNNYGTALTGYIAAEHVIDLTNCGFEVRPDGGYVNVREAPSKHAESIADIYPGQRVTEYYQEQVGNTTWSYVNYGNGCGWVNNFYIGLWN